MNERPDTIPQPPTVPRDLAAEPSRGAHLVDAPAWAIAVIDEMQRTRSEVASAMGDFADAAAALERQSREVLANQSSLQRSFDDLRREFRSRVGAHDGEFNDVRSRLASLERDIADLNAVLNSAVDRS